MDEICLFGASGHGKVVKDVALSQNKVVLAFFDDNLKIDFNGETPVFSLDKKADCLCNQFLISVGDNQIRKKVSIKLGVSYATLVHKKAILAPTVCVLEGTVILAGAIINADAKIGKHVIINTAAVIEHDCNIADFVHISPNATLAGNVRIGLGTHIGAGAIIIPNIKIGKWAIVGAGAVVIKDVPDYATVVGNPARIINYKEKENE
tara:strand:- start:3621 stop:4241 length:621 start_codon:yes stop_codon:yes gene_type:complete